MTKADRKRAFDVQRGRMTQEQADEWDMQASDLRFTWVLQAYELKRNAERKTEREAALLCDAERKTEREAALHKHSNSRYGPGPPKHRASASIHKGRSDRGRTI